MNEILPSSELASTESAQGKSAREVCQRGYEAGAREMKEKMKAYRLPLIFLMGLTDDERDLIEQTVSQIYSDLDDL